jgi:hypothetical protein
MIPGSTGCQPVRFGLLAETLFCSGGVPPSQTIISAEKPLNQFVAADFKMRSHVAKNSGQCSHFERVVIGNSDMMLVALARGQPQMTARLARDRIPEALQPFGQVRS